MIPVNLGDQLQVGVIIPSAAIAANANGTGLDIQQYEGEVCFILNSALGTGNADNTLDIKIQDSADNSTGWADVSGAAFTQVTTAASVQKLSLVTDNVARYVRAVKTVGGTTPSFIAGCVLVGMKKNPA